MALRVRAIPYVYDLKHDINDVIRQYNSLSPNHSKVPRLRDEFDKLNTPPFSDGQTLQIPVLTVAIGPHTSGKFKLENVAEAVVDTPQEKPEPEKPAVVKPEKPVKAKPTTDTAPSELPFHLRPENQVDYNAAGTGTPLTPDKKDIRLLGGTEIRPGVVLRGGCLFKVVDLRDDVPVQSESMFKQEK